MEPNKINMPTIEALPRRPKIRPEKVIDARDREAREVLMVKILKEVDALNDSIRAIGIDGQINEGGYRSELRNETPKFLDTYNELKDNEQLAEGPLALLWRDLIAVYQIRLDRLDSAVRNLTPEKIELMKGFSVWQQYLSNFLIEHLGLAVFSSAENSVHNQFYRQLFRRLKESVGLIQKVFRESVSESIIFDTVSRMWQSGVGGAAAFDFWTRVGWEFKWSTPSVDVENGIDFFVRNPANGKTYAVSLKTKRSEPPALFVPGSPKLRTVGSSVHDELNKVISGVHRNNSQERREQEIDPSYQPNYAEPLLMYSAFGSAYTDPKSGRITNKAFEALLKDLEALP